MKNRYIVVASVIGTAFLMTSCAYDGGVYGDGFYYDSGPYLYDGSFFDYGYGGGSYYHGHRHHGYGHGHGHSHGGGRMGGHSGGGHHGHR